MSYVVKDLDILSQKHKVRTLHFKSKKDLFFNLFKILWQFLSGVIWCDITFTWFGKLHALFAVLFSKLFHRKSVVVAGGDDVVYAPEIKYGMFSHWWKRWCPLYVFKNADRILSVSNYNREETLRNANVPTHRIKLIYHGFDMNKFFNKKETKKESLALTVGGVNWERVHRKGYELFVRSAIFLPNVKFMLIGHWQDDSIRHLKSIASNNVEFHGRISDSDLVDLLSRAKVYVQVSTHEAFGCSIAEAMLCECIPVVSNMAAIPEVVGGCGFYVERLSPENVAEKIKEAMSTSEDLGKKARERIKTHFSLETRKIDLLHSIESLKL